jgi:hypothetical protein
VGEGVALEVQASKGEFFGRSFVIFLCNSHVKRSINERMHVEDTKFDLTPYPLQVSAHQMLPYPMLTHQILSLQILFHLAPALPVSAHIKGDGAVFYHMMI